MNGYWLFLFTVFLGIYLDGTFYEWELMIHPDEKLSDVITALYGEE